MSTQRECSVDGCSRPLHNRKTGYCKSHQQRHHRYPQTEMSTPLTRVIDMSGQKFGNLTVVSRGAGSGPKAYWNCICECGKTMTVSGEQIRSGKTTSCGCRVAEKNRQLRVTHGQASKGASTAEYRAWHGMRQRCFNKTDHAYPNYGGRGITVSAKWVDDFEAFYSHIGPKPGPGYSVDRIDNDGSYEPGNVRWATAKQQANNRRSSRKAPK